MEIIYSLETKNLGNATLFLADGSKIKTVSYTFGDPFYVIQAPPPFGLTSIINKKDTELRHISLNNLPEEFIGLLKVVHNDPIEFKNHLTEEQWKYFLSFSYISKK